MEKTEDLHKKIDDANMRLHANTTWRHYKGGIYSVKGFAIDTDNGEVRVLYNRLNGDPHIMDSRIIYARPFKEWFEDVEPEPGVFIPRFKRIRKAEAWITDDQEIFTN